jgi:hypothetical protein
MAKRLIGLSALVVAAPLLSGCVAAAIPALAGTAMFGKEVVGRDAEEQSAPDQVAAAPAPASAPDPAPAPARTPNPAPAPAAESTLVMAASAAPEPTPLPATPTPPPAPAPQPVPAPPAPPALAAAVTAPTPAPTPAPVPSAARRTVPTMAIAAYPDPTVPIGPEHLPFARFVRYGQASAAAAQEGTELPSAMLTDPVALDGKRRRCGIGEQQVALIDLDPAGGLFAPPSAPAVQPGLALGLALLREAGVEIAWISDLPTAQSGALRTAIEQSGLDPRGEDIVSLRRDEADTKQKRRDNLAGIACIVAIAGDERPDFDERFRYLRNPEAGAPLEPLIGDGWFLIAPLLGNQGQ